MVSFYSRAPGRPVYVPWMLSAGLISIAMSPILVRFAGEVPPVTIAVWRTGLAVLFLSPFVFRKAIREIRTLSLKEYLLIVAAGINLGFHFIGWIEALFLTSIASATVLVSTSPIFIAILGYFFLRERLSFSFVAALAGAVLGAALIGWGDAVVPVIGGRNPWLGNSLATLAALFVSIYLLIGRVVRQEVSWLAYVFPLYVVVACTTVVVALLRGVPLVGYSWNMYGLFAVMALFPSIVGHGSFNLAVKYYPTAFLGVLSLSEPVIASVVALFLFDERPGWLGLIGMVVVLLAIFVVIVNRNEQKGYPESLPNSVIVDQ